MLAYDLPLPGLQEGPTGGGGGVSQSASTKTGSKTNLQDVYPGITHGRMPTVLMIAVPDQLQLPCGLHSHGLGCPVMPRRSINY